MVNFNPEKKGANQPLWKKMALKFPVFIVAIKKGSVYLLGAQIKIPRTQAALAAGEASTPPRPARALSQAALVSSLQELCTLDA